MSLHPLQRRRSMTLDKLGLPFRARNALRLGRIHTMGELAAMSADHLLALRGIGAVSIEHIETALQSCGLALEPSPFSKPPPWVAAATIEHRERVERRRSEVCPECGR